MLRDVSPTVEGPAATSGWTNRALWSKAVRESALLLAALVVMLFAFAWVYVWLISRVKLPALFDFLVGGLKDFEKLSGVPFRDVATPEGRLALAFVDPLVHLAFVVWGISRGSDTVSGEVERGTMEMLLAQPVSRLAVYLSKSAVTVAGLVVLAVALWCGLAMGIRTVPEVTGDVASSLFALAAANVLGLGFAVAGIAALVSSLDRYRWRTVGIMGGFYAVSIILKVIARMAPGWQWLGYASIFTAFEPQRLVADSAEAWTLLGQYNGVLMGVGLLCYLAGAMVFCHRDLPAPL